MLSARLNGAFTHLGLEYFRYMSPRSTHFRFMFAGHFWRTKMLPTIAGGIKIFVDGPVYTRRQELIDVQRSNVRRLRDGVGVGIMQAYMRIAC